jgi:hypothetical protein
MSKAQRKRPADAASDPASRFDAPQEIVNDASLSNAEKTRALDAWEEDARRLAVATEEGMSGGEPSRLDEVAEAKAKLGIKGERRPARTKAG